MSEISEPSPFRIRPLDPGDLPALLDMVRELAEFEKLEDQLTATESDYREVFFGGKPAAGALIAEENGAPVGYAIYFTTFSTFLGKAGIWLEDLYVKAPARGRGHGRALLRAVGTIARERGAGRYEWSVLDWNRRAIDLYQRAGAEVLPDWRIVRMDREGIQRFLDA